MSRQGQRSVLGTCAVWLLLAASAVAQAVTTNSLTLDAAIERFLRLFPMGFDDPGYLGDRKTGERNYKLAAHEHYQAHLGDGKLGDVLKSDVSKAIAEAERTIGMVNLLHKIEISALRDGLRDENAARRFFEALDDLLLSPTIEQSLVETYFNAVDRLPAEGGRVAIWTVATILPFLAQPAKYIFVKPTVTQAVADSLGFHIRYRPDLNWETYEAVLRMANMYKERLAHLKPRDFIDVQSFFWVACGGYE